MKFVIYRNETAVGFDVIQIFFNESDKFILERYLVINKSRNNSVTYYFFNESKYKFGKFCMKIIVDRDIKSALLNIKHPNELVKKICIAVALSKGDYEVYDNNRNILDILDIGDWLKV